MRESEGQSEEPAVVPAAFPRRRSLGPLVLRSMLRSLRFCSVQRKSVLLLLRRARVALFTPGARPAAASIADGRRLRPPADPRFRPLRSAGT